MEKHKSAYPSVVDAFSNNGQTVFIHFVLDSCHVTREFYFEFLEEKLSYYLLTQRSLKNGPSM